MSKKLIIIGASGHGKVIADIAEKNGYTEIAFLDDNPDVKECMDYPVIGKTENAQEYPDAQFMVAIGNPKIRQKVQERLADRKLSVTSLIHPQAVVADRVEIGEGTVVMAGAVINPDCEIGKGCIVNTGASVDHDNVLEDFVHISVGSHLAGTVKVGERTWIGAGAVVNNNVTICADCMIGSGAVVVKNIDEPGTYTGVPAGKMINGDDMKKRHKILGGVAFLHSCKIWEPTSETDRRMAA